MEGDSKWNKIILTTRLFQLNSPYQHYLHLSKYHFIFQIKYRWKYYFIMKKKKSKAFYDLIKFLSLSVILKSNLAIFLKIITIKYVDITSFVIIVKMQQFIIHLNGRKGQFYRLKIWSSWDQNNIWCRHLWTTFYNSYYRLSIIINICNNNCRRKGAITIWQIVVNKRYEKKRDYFFFYTDIKKRLRNEDGVHKKKKKMWRVYDENTKMMRCGVRLGKTGWDGSRE